MATVMVWLKWSLPHRKSSDAMLIIQHINYIISCLTNLPSKFINNVEDLPLWSHVPILKDRSMTLSVVFEQYYIV